MLIPINNVVRFGVPIASTYYNTETCKLLEDSCCGRNLPSMDYLSCGVDNPNRISTVIGRVSELFVVSSETKSRSRSSKTKIGRASCRERV